MKDILGLRLWRGRVVDRFEILELRKTFDGMLEAAPIMFGSAKGDLNRVEDAFWKKIGIIRLERDNAYNRALSLLIRVDPVYENYLPRQIRKNWNHKKTKWRPSSKKKKLIRLSVWVLMGNQIPVGDLDGILVSNLLKKRECVFVRKNKKGWCLSDESIGQNYSQALEFWEKFEPVDRTSLVDGLIIHV